MSGPGRDEGASGPADGGWSGGVPGSRGPEGTGPADEHRRPPEEQAENSRPRPRTRRGGRVAPDEEGGRKRLDYGSGLPALFPDDGLHWTGVSSVCPGDWRSDSSGPPALAYPRGRVGEGRERSVHPGAHRGDGLRGGFLCVRHRLAPRRTRPEIAAATRPQ